MPDWKKYLRENLSLPVMDGHRDARAIDEMADHLEDLYQEALSRGVIGEEAERMVLSWLGDTGRAAEELMAVEPHQVGARVDRWLQGREEDLRIKGSLGATLADGLRDAADAAGVPIRQNRVGSMQTLFFTDGPVTDFQSAKRSDTVRYGEWFHGMLAQGVHFAPSQFEAAFVSTAHTPEHVEKTVAAARTVMETLA